MDRAVDDLFEAIGEDVPADDCERVLAALERHDRRVAGLRLKVVSKAQHSEPPRGAGFASTEAGVAQRTRTTRSTAARQVALATELESGHDVTGAALDDGLVSASHAAVIVARSLELPASVTPAQREVGERQLVEEAQRLDPEQLRRRARLVLETGEAQPAVGDAKRAPLRRERSA